MLFSRSPGRDCDLLKQALIPALCPNPRGSMAHGVGLGFSRELDGPSEFRSSLRDLLELVGAAAIRLRRGVQGARDADQVANGRDGELVSVRWLHSDRLALRQTRVDAKL